VSKLAEVASNVLGVLEVVAGGRPNIIRQDKIHRILHDYEALEVCKKAIEGVFKYVLNHNFLKFLYSALVDAKEDDEVMYCEIDKYVAQLGKIPAKFVQWLKAAYMYCDLVRVLRVSVDWIGVFDSTTALLNAAETLFTTQVRVKILSRC
jgi:uncharacterized membrane protein YkgB